MTYGTVGPPCTWYVGPTLWYHLVVDLEVLQYLVYEYLQYIVATTP